MKPILASDLGTFGGHLQYNTAHSLVCVLALCFVELSVSLHYYTVLDDAPDLPELVLANAPWVTSCIVWLFGSLGEWLKIPQ